MITGRRIIAIAQDADGSSYGTLASDLSHLICADYILFCLQHTNVVDEADLDDFSRHMLARYQRFLTLNPAKRAEEVQRCMGEIIGFGRATWVNEAYTKLECYRIAYKFLLSNIRKTHPIWLNELFAVANKVVQDYTAALAQPGDLVLVGSFSNRLHQATDLLAMKRNYTHSFFHDLPYFSLHLREFFQPLNVDVIFNPLLLTDIVGNLQPGEYMMSLLTGSKMHVNLKCHFDHSKISSLLLIAHNLANRFPKDKIRLIVLEDKNNIISGLTETFELAQALLPENIELDVCRLRDGLEHIKLIPGTGRINQHYARDIRHLLALSKYQALLDNPKSTSVDIYLSVDFREYYAYLEFSAGHGATRVKIVKDELYDAVFLLILRYIIHHHGLKLLVLYNQISAGKEDCQLALEELHQQLENTLDDFSATKTNDYDHIETDEVLSTLYNDFHHYFSVVAPKFIGRLLYFVHKESLIDHTEEANNVGNKAVLLEPKFTDAACIQDLHYLTSLLNDSQPPVFFMLDRRFSGSKLFHELEKDNKQKLSHEPIPAEPNEQKTHLTYNSLINFFRRSKKKEKKAPTFRQFSNSSK